MTAIGIDLGGTKIEAQVFDGDWQVTETRRVETPKAYDDLVTSVADQLAWAAKMTDKATPIGIGAAGLINPQTGLALAANLFATGRPLPADIATASGFDVLYLNDARALTLSEAVFGAGQGHRTVLSLVMGTGIGGGVAINGALQQGPTQTGGEFGHISAPAAIIHAHGLPVIPCGCGRLGCIENYISGPGMTRVAKALTGGAQTPTQIAQDKGSNPNAAAVWRVWCELTADLMRGLTLTIDPDIIILGGGLSQMSGVAEDLRQAFQAAQMPTFDTPKIAVVQPDANSGARGAAYAAWQAQANT